MYQVEILEITPKNHFALFKRSDGEFGWLEVMMGEVFVGDILTELNDRDFLKCKSMYCIRGKERLRICISDLGEEKDMRQEVRMYDKKL